MLTKPRYTVKDLLLWTRREIFMFFVLSALITTLIQVSGLNFLYLPWPPITVIGTAVAFIIGFQNNSAYGRIWEARKIWGGIVNTSRTWGMKLEAMISNEHAHEPVSEETLKELHKTFIYRHIAWLTALRHAMRQPKKWEEFLKHHTNEEWAIQLHIPEKMISLEEDLSQYLSDEERHYVLSKTNKAAAILNLQSRHLKALKGKGLVWEFSFLELENLLEEMFSLQGKSERIKNFPYPRQYATLSYYFVRIFIFLLPFAAIPEFAKIGEQLQAVHPMVAPHFIWVGIPFCMLASWVFYTMERIGRVGENPFEGSANDVPISTIARGIEIDLRELLNEDKEQIPKPYPEIQHVQM